MFIVSDRAMQKAISTMDKHRGQGYQCLRVIRRFDGQYAIAREEHRPGDVTFEHRGQVCVALDGRLKLACVNFTLDVNASGVWVLRDRAANRDAA